MKNAYQMSDKASFRQQKLHDFNEAKVQQWIHLKVQGSLWQRFLRAIGL
jgi:hypothetical protein